MLTTEFSTTLTLRLAILFSHSIALLSPPSFQTVVVVEAVSAEEVTVGDEEAIEEEGEGDTVAEEEEEAMDSE